MKNIFDNVIEQGNFDLADVLAKIEKYHIEGRLSDLDKDELIRKARYKANPFYRTDIVAKLLELEERVRKLEHGETPDAPSEGYPEYVAGKWYYAGDKISYGGKNYVCVAPDGAVCTWNPDEYPSYWNIEE